MNTLRVLRGWSGLLLYAVTTLTMSACAVGPDFVKPPPPQGAGYSSTPPIVATASADGAAQRFEPGKAVAEQWWTQFRSAPIDAMVRKALTDSPTLLSAEAKLRQSQDNLRAGYGVFFPQIGIDLGRTRERSAPTLQGSAAPGNIFNVVTAGASISYALDVFGGQRRMVEGLRAQTDVQSEAVKAAHLALAANVVNAGIARAAYVTEIRQTEELIALENEQLVATEAQVAAGTSAYAGVLTLRGQIAGNRAALAAMHQKADQAAHLLAMLQGVTPAQVVIPNMELDGISLPADLPVSLPSELVRRRPDILAAEARMHAASADIGVATAAMFPSFVLSGTYGAAGSGLNSLGGESGRFWSVGPSLSVPLFHGGSLWYGRKAAIDAFQAAEADYRQTVLVAFDQVADSLKALEHDAETLQAQSDALHAAEQSLQLLRASYLGGMAPYLDVLAVDVQLHQARIGYLDAQAQRLQDTVALYAALGGGWQAAKDGP